jgi:hypothetical protein
MWTPGELKGIDMVPWSLLGASKSSLMYQLYVGEMRSYINFCAEMLDTSTNIFRNKIAEEVESSGVFEEGRKFLSANLKDSIVQNSERSVLALKEKGIPLGKWSYKNSPKRFVNRAIADNPRLIELVKRAKTSEVRQIVSKMKILPMKPGSITLWLRDRDQSWWFQRMVRDMRGYTFGERESDMQWGQLTGDVFVHIVFSDPGVRCVVVTDESEEEYDSRYVVIRVENIWSIPVSEYRKALSGIRKHGILLKDRMYNQYSWQESLFFRWEDEVPYVGGTGGVCPVVGLDEKIRDIMLRVGVSSHGDDNAIRISKLGAALIKDRNLPNDITSETLLGVLLKPEIFANPHHISLVLTGMGASAESAEKFATSIVHTSNNFVMANTIQSFSTRDMIIGHLDLRFENYDRLVSDISIPDRKLAGYLSGMGALHSLLSKDSVRKTHIWVRGNELSSLYRTVQGSLFDDLQDQIRFYPESPI